MVGAWRPELPPLSHHNIDLLPSLFPPGKVSCDLSWRLQGDWWDGVSLQRSPHWLNSVSCSVNADSRTNWPALSSSFALSGIGPTFILGRGHQGLGSFLLLCLGTAITGMCYFLPITLVSVSPSSSPLS